MPDPSVLYCSDEDVKIRCSGDFDTLLPADQVIAGGSDGFIAASSPWVLASSVNFATAGVKAGNVLRVKIGTPGIPAHFAVVSAANGSLAFRRIGLKAGEGLPAVTANATLLQFSVPTFRPQIEDASYDLNRRYGINDDFADRQASYLYDPRELRQACVLTVLMRQYANENRAKDGDFALKIMVVKQELDDVLARISVKFGQLGQGAEPVNRFSTRIRR